MLEVAQHAAIINTIQVARVRSVTGIQRRCKKGKLELGHNYSAGFDIGSYLEECLESLDFTSELYVTSPRLIGISSRTVNHIVTGRLQQAGFKMPPEACIPGLLSNLETLVEDGTYIFPVGRPVRARVYHHMSLTVKKGILRGSWLFLSYDVDYQPDTKIICAR